MAVANLSVPGLGKAAEAVSLPVTQSNYRPTSLLTMPHFDYHFSFVHVGSIDLSDTLDAHSVPLLNRKGMIAWFQYNTGPDTIIPEMNFYRQVYRVRVNRELRR